MAEHKKGIKARVLQNVMRAKIEVEVEGDADTVAAALDEILASVTKHFPAIETQDVVLPAARSRQPVDK